MSMPISIKAFFFLFDMDLFLGNYVCARVCLSISVFRSQHLQPEHGITQR